MPLRKRKYLYQNRLNFQEYSHFNTRKTKTHTGFVEKASMIVFFQNVMMLKGIESVFDLSFLCNNQKLRVLWQKLCVILQKLMR